MMQKNVFNFFYQKNWFQIIKILETFFQILEKLETFPKIISKQVLNLIVNWVHHLFRFPFIR